MGMRCRDSAGGWGILTAGTLASGRLASFGLKYVKCEELLPNLRLPILVELGHIQDRLESLAIRLRGVKASKQEI